MALNKDNFVSAMIDAVKEYPEGGAEAIKALGKAIEDYICENTEAKYSWTGVHTSSGSSDTTTSFDVECEASGSDFSCSPEDFDSFISGLALFLNGIKIKAPSGFVLMLNSKAGTFTASQIGELEDVKDVDKAMKAAYGEIAQGIIDGLQSYFIPVMTGTHGDYAGSATFFSVK